MVTAIHRDPRFVRLVVCTACGHLRGPWRRPGHDPEEPVQRCRCERSPGDPAWPGYDHNTVAELCRCCALEAVPSGSKWSVWFCGPCLGRIRELNAGAGRCVVPIGRHSLMNGIGYRPGAGRDDRRAIAAFGDQLSAFFAAADDTDRWRQQVVARNLTVTGLEGAPSVPLRVYVARTVRAGLSKEPAFEALVEAATRSGPVPWDGVPRAEE